MNYEVSSKSRLSLKPTAREPMSKMFKKKREREKFKCGRRENASFQNMTEFDVISNR